MALAALADQFSAMTAIAAGRADAVEIAGAADVVNAAPIPPQFFYALFRAGLPANPDTLFQADASTLESIWKQAATQGVIPEQSAEQIRA